MKLWLFTNEYLPFFGGGIATYCYHTAQMLSREGHRVTVIVGDRSLTSSTLTIEEGRIRIVRYSPGISKITSFGPFVGLSYDIAAVAADLIRKEGAPDVVECQEYLGLPYFLLQRQLTLDPVFKNIPIVLTTHTPEYICN